MTGGDSSRRAIADDEVNALAAIAAKLAPTYVDPEKDPWAGSPFAWIRTRPSRQVGKIGEQLVADWASAKGLKVTRTGDAEADRVINGLARYEASDRGRLRDRPASSRAPSGAPEGLGR